MWLCKLLLSSRHTPSQKFPQSDSKLANSVNCWWGHPVTVQSPLPFFSAFCIYMWIDETHQQVHLTRAPLNPTHCNNMHAALTGSQSQSPPRPSAFRPSSQTLTQALDPTKASSEPNCALKTGVQPGSDPRQPYRLGATIIGTSGVTIARNLRWNSANSERQTRWILAPEPWPEERRWWPVLPGRTATCPAFHVALLRTPAGRRSRGHGPHPVSAPRCWRGPFLA